MCTNPKHSVGFSLLEVVMAIVILSILSAVAVPKFFDNTPFQARGFADQVITILRYAQKMAIAQHQTVCVTITSTSISLKIDATCATNLNLADRQTNSLIAPSGVSLTTTSANISFDALGKPSSAASITISGVTPSITIEAETGYVHQ